MKKYKVTVNGHSYEVEIELIDEKEAAKPETATRPVTKSAGGKQVLAPMPGTILSVNVASGQAVKKGDVLFNGHFHTPANRVMENGAYYANCGSIALPKEDTHHSYILVEDNTLTWKDLESGGMFDCLTLE